MFAAAIVALGWIQEPAAEAPVPAERAPLPTIRARQVAAVSVGEPLDGILLDVQWVSADMAMALVARERTELVMYELRDTVWMAAHIVPVPPSVAGLADVRIRVAPVLPGKVLVAYSGEAGGQPRTIVLSVALLERVVAEAASWPFRVTDIAGAGPDRFAAELDLDGRESMVITDKVGHVVATTDDRTVTSKQLGAWDESSKALVCLGMGDLLLVDGSAQIRDVSPVIGRGTVQAIAGALDGSSYFGSQSSTELKIVRLENGKASEISRLPVARILPTMMGPIIQRTTDVRVETSSIEIVSVDSLQTYEGTQLARSRALSGLSVGDFDSYEGALFASPDRDVVWVIRDFAEKTEIHRYSIADMKETTRAEAGGGVRAVGETCNGELLCVKSNGSGEGYRVAVDGSVRAESCESFSAYFGCVEGVEVVRRGARLDDLVPSTTPRHLRPRMTFASVIDYRPCVLTDGSEVRLIKHSQQPWGHGSRNSRAYWTLEHRSRDFQPISETVLRPDPTNSRLERASTSGSRLGARFSDGTLCLYDADRRSCGRVTAQLPAPGPHLYFGDAVLCDSGQSVILWDGETGKLRKLEFVAEGH